MKLWIICNTIFMEYQGEISLELNWSELYPDSVEDISPDMQYPEADPVSITTFVDADHADDL